MTGIYSARDIEKLVNGAGFGGGGGGTIDESKFVKSENGTATNLTTKGILNVQGNTPSWVVDNIEKVAEFNGYVDFNAGVNFQFPEKIVWNFDDGKAPTTRTIQQKNLKSLCQDIVDIKEEVEKIKVPDAPPATGTPIDTSNLATKEEITAINTNITELQKKTQHIADTGLPGGKFDFWISERENALATEIVQATNYTKNQLPDKIKELEDKTKHLNLDGYAKSSFVVSGLDGKISTGMAIVDAAKGFPKCEKQVKNLNEEGFATNTFKIIGTNKNATADQITEGIAKITTLETEMNDLKNKPADIDISKLDEKYINNQYYQGKKIKDSSVIYLTPAEYQEMTAEDRAAYNWKIQNLKSKQIGQLLDKTVSLHTKLEKYMVGTLKTNNSTKIFKTVTEYQGMTAEEKEKYTWNTSYVKGKEIGQITYDLSNTSKKVNSRCQNLNESGFATTNFQVAYTTKGSSKAYYFTDNLVQEHIKMMNATHFVNDNIYPATLKFGDEGQALYLDKPAYFHWGFYLRTVIEKDKAVMACAKVKTETNNYVVDSAWIAQFFINTMKFREISADYLTDQRRIEPVVPYTLRTLSLEDEIVDEPTNTETTTTEEEEVDEGAPGTEDNPIIWDGSKMAQINQKYDETWKETMDYLHANVEETYNDIKANYQTNKQIGKFCRNSLFCESMKGKIPLKPLKPQELASYGFVEFAQSDLEMYDEGGFFAIILVAGKELSETESKLDISLQGLQHYHANHFILHLFDRKRHQKIYDLNGIDHVFEFILSDNNLTIKSDLSSDLYTFTYTYSEDVLKVSITGSLKLKLVYDAADNQYWNADEGWEKKEDKELENRLVVYYELPINENFKNYLASLGTGGGSLDSSIYSRVSDLESIIKDLTQTFQEHNTKIDYKMENENYESLAPHTYAIENQEGNKNESESTNIFDKWVSTTSDQFDYFNQGIKDIWSFCAGMSEDIGNLEDNLGSASDFSKLEDRLKVLETKCQNIEGDTPTLSTGQLTIENLMNSYNERITILEKKCQNIK